MSTDIERKTVNKALRKFAHGDPVLVHDASSRENETDIIYPASAVDPDAVARLRNDAGGLICTALSAEVADAFSLPFLTTEISHPASENINLEYGERSSFSLPVNHRETRTGITDKDRSLTISKLAEAASEPDSISFANQFRAPGHVPVLRAAEGLLTTRQGHTELGVAMAIETGMAPAAVVCEMLDDASGDALTTTKAQEYARENDFIYIEGSRLIKNLCAKDGPL